MFELVRELLPFVALIYVFDALTLLGPGHLLFLAELRGFVVKHPGARLTGLTPWARGYLSDQRRVALTATGVVVPRDVKATGARCYEPASYEVVPYAALAGLALEHRRLRLGSSRGLQLPSKAHAAALFDDLRQLYRLSSMKERRRLCAQRVRAAGDLAAFKDRQARVLELRKPLVRLCTVLCAALFIGLPIIVYGDLPRLVLGLWLTALGVGYLLAIWETVRLVKRVRRDELCRLDGFLAPVLLSPPATLRAAVAVIQGVGVGFDPLTLAAALLPRDEALSWLRAELHAIRYALSGHDGEDDAWRELWQSREQLVAILLAELGVTSQDALAALEPRDPTAVAYCPLCDGEYLKAVASCEECDMPLVFFADANPDAAPAV